MAIKRDVKLLRFHIRDHRLKTCLMVLYSLSFLFLAVTNHTNPITFAATAKAYIFIAPPSYIAKEIGETFDMAINVSNVENLRSVKFTLTYNTSLLDVTQVVQGSFFPTPPRSYFKFERNESLGFVTVNMSLASSESSLSGNGTLAWVSFKVVLYLESCVSSPLELQQTSLLGPASIPIAHDSVGGLYIWKSMQADPPVNGRSLDLYTQKGGEGQDEPGGEFVGGEEVQLISLVTYNNDSVQQKLVAFEVRDPSNESVVIRTAITDQEGLARISFRIPSVPWNNGTWTVISVVSIAEKAVWDILSFQVLITFPVGGYSVQPREHTTNRYLTPCVTLIAALTAISTTIKRKMRKKLGHFGRACRTLTLMFLLTFLGFNILLETCKATDILITDFYSCDKLGVPQNYFPKKTTAYFNITVTNLAQNPKNSSIYLTVQDELEVPIGSDQRNSTISGNTTVYHIMSIFIPKWAYVGYATAYVSVRIGGVAVASESTDLIIGPEDLSPPVIHISSPQNLTYNMESVPLVITLNERTDWMGYSLNRQQNVTIPQNTTLTGLANGSYSVIAYANDTSGNVGSSEEAYFTILIIHDVAIFDLKCSTAQAYIGQTVNITVFVRNEGNVPETFNVTTYADATAIAALSVTNLSPNDQKTLSFIWNTTGASGGNYTMRAYITPVPNETDITDNNYIDGIVNVMPPPDISVTNLATSKTVVGQGYSISINVTVRNEGDYTENFSLIVYANTTSIQTKRATLLNGSSTTVAFTCNTTGFAKGNYTIWAYAVPVLGETETEDNIKYFDGIVKVTIPGDVDGDFKVTMNDIVLLCEAFGSTLKADGWYWHTPPCIRCPHDRNLDINSDGRIGIDDIIIACSNSGKAYP